MIKLLDGTTAGDNVDFEIGYSKFIHSTMKNGMAFSSSSIALMLNPPFMDFLGSLAYVNFTINQICNFIDNVHNDRISLVFIFFNEFCEQRQQRTMLR